MAEIKLWPHQQATYDFGKDLPSFVDGSDPGCVDCETEFLTPIGWKPISEYINEDLVAQFHPSTFQIEFKKPLDYVTKNCSVMHHYKIEHSLDMVLSYEHRVLSYPRAETKDKRHNWSVMSSTEFVDRVRQRHIAAAFIAPDNLGLSIEDNDLLVMVAVIEHGYFPDSTNICTIQLNRGDQKARLRSLLNAANIGYKERSGVGVKRD